MNTDRRVLPMGERALLVEVADTHAVLAVHAALAASPPTGVLELVPAARTVLVRFDPRRIRATAVREWALGTVAADGGAPHPGSEVTLPVVYDGPDLDDTARLLGTRPDQLIARHAGTRWRVAFTGFAPGFGYLVGDDWPYDVPRLDVPRTRVPAGAVGLAAGFSGAYPRETPGGWRLIGVTPATLFDPDAESPALLTPGTTVRFVATRAQATASRAEPTASEQPGASRHPHREAGDAGTVIARVDAVGNATVQDLGRPDAAHLGVARSGALDRGALRLANRLVGNPEHAAAVEIAPGGLIATAVEDTWIALTGTWAPIRLDDRPIDAYRAVPWPAGTRLEVGWPDHGARTYLAVAGGIDAPAVLGSAATDTLAGLGPARLRVGDTLRAHRDLAGPVPPLDIAPWGWPPELRELRMRWGPRAGWFTPAARRSLAQATWTAGVDSDRVGMRVEGPELPRLHGGELPSEPMVPGALQVPPSGRPVVLLADGPVTGGYPVIAVLDDASLDTLGQAPPGTRLRFRLIG